LANDKTAGNILIKKKKVKKKNRYYRTRIEERASTHLRFLALRLLLIVSSAPGNKNAINRAKNSLPAYYRGVEHVDPLLDD